MVWVKRDGPSEHGISRMRAHRHRKPNSPPASRYGGMNKVEYATKRVLFRLRRAEGGFQSVVLAQISGQVPFRDPSRQAHTLIPMPWDRYRDKLSMTIWVHVGCEH